MALAPARLNAETTVCECGDPIYKGNDGVWYHTGTGNKYCGWSSVNTIQQEKVARPK